MNTDTNPAAPTAHVAVPASPRTLTDIMNACQALAERVGTDAVRAEKVESFRQWWPAARRDTTVAYALHTGATETLVRWTEEDAAATPAPARKVPAPEGMHAYGGMIWKVQAAVNGSGRVYAKALEEDGDGGWTFTYVPGAVRNLSERTLLSLDEAKKFGALYGTCCVCARTLTNEESIAAGIGPICAEKF